MDYTIGWIGTGVMGLPMAQHLLDAGCTLTVHTRTRQRAQPLLEAGARWADSPAQAADGADLAVSMVGYPEDVRVTHLGEHGTLRADRPPRTIIDMTTSSPSLAREIHAAASRMGVNGGVGAIDAPVSGGDIGARNATLSIMVGGDENTLRHVRPVLERLGRLVVHQGGPGSGQHTKMVNQILIAGNMMGVCEGLLYAQRAGLDPGRVLESVAGGAAGSWSISNLGPRIIAGDFEPGFYVEHFVKDLGIALAEADKLGLELPGLELAGRLYEQLKGAGLGRKGTQALFALLERQAAALGSGAPPASC